MLTRRLKPVTPEREMATAVLERGSSPRWPTIITEMTCNKYCERFTAIIGPATYPKLFTSLHKTLHLSSIFPSSPPLSFTTKPSSILYIIDLYLRLYPYTEPSRAEQSRAEPLLITTYIND